MTALLHDKAHQPHNIYSSCLRLGHNAVRKSCEMTSSDGIRTSGYLQILPDCFVNAAADSGAGVFESGGRASAEPHTENEKKRETRQIRKTPGDSRFSIFRKSFYRRLMIRAVSPFAVNAFHESERKMRESKKVVASLSNSWKHAN